MSSEDNNMNKDNLEFSLSESAINGSSAVSDVSSNGSHHHHHHSHHHHQSNKSIRKRSSSGSDKKAFRFSKIFRQNALVKKKKIRTKKTWYEKLSKKDRKRLGVLAGVLGVVIIILLVIFIPKIFHQHEYGEWITEENSTCTTNGYQASYCKICSNRKTRVLEASHDFVFDNFDSTTKEYLYICSVCGEKKVESEYETGEIILPDYYRSELSSLVENINTIVTDDSIVFAQITDVHYDQEISEPIRDRQLFVVNQLCEQGILDFAVLGGDLTTGSSKENATNIINNTMSILTNSTTPVLAIKGDHDVNTHYPEEYYENEPGDAQITVSEWMDIVSDYMPYVVRPTGKTITEQSVSWLTQKENLINSDNYYYDLPDKKVRVICLDTGTFSSITFNGINYTSEGYVQPRALYRWLTGEVFTDEVKDGWEFIVVTHIPVDSDYLNSTSASYLLNFDTLCEAINSQSEWKYDNLLGVTSGTCSEEKDFSNWTSKVRSYVSGHLHLDRLDVLNDSDIGVCVTACATNQSKEKTSYLTQFRDRNNWALLSEIGVTHEENRPDGDITEALFDVIVINPDSITRLRFGAGQKVTSETFNNSVVPEKKN